MKKSQSGLSLVVVMSMLGIILLLSVITAKVSLLGEKSARNDRDRQIAFQAAEAALSDAQLDIFGPNPAANSRCGITSDDLKGLFDSGCSSTSASRGLCTSDVGKIGTSYASVNFEDFDNSTRVPVVLGEFTGRTANFPIGSNGLSAQLPRYVIELVPHRAILSNGTTVEKKAFLVTAVGYGPTIQTKVMLQTTLFKPKLDPASLTGC
jgi:type IV pilus assembly protein PilX